MLSPAVTGRRCRAIQPEDRNNEGAKPHFYGVVRLIDYLGPMMFDRNQARATYLTVQQRLRAKSAALLLTLETGLPRIMIFWFMLALGACGLRIATSNIHAAPDLSTFMPYVLLVGAPLLSMGLALMWFANGDRLAQPSIRLAVVGRWQDIGRDQASRHPLYGSSGIMVSLLVGMLLNVPVRALEYLAAMPALAGNVPAWLSTLHIAMTLDVVLLSSLYTIAFVAALKRVPLFPRLLAAIWLVDIVMQLGIASAVAGTEGLPVPVADALHTLLDGNVKKVMISVCLWLPYLLLSKRVNVTYRHRVEA